MAHGGKRPGAGRKKGSKSKLTKAVEKIVEQLPSTLPDGLLPLDYMLQVMRDVGMPTDIRLDAAKAAAPYVHKKQPQDVNVEANGFPTPAPTVLILNAGDHLKGDTRAE